MRSKLLRALGTMAVAMSLALTFFVFFGGTASAQEDNYTGEVTIVTSEGVTVTATIDPHLYEYVRGEFKIITTTLTVQNGSVEEHRFTFYSDSSYSVEVRLINAQVLDRAELWCNYQQYCSSRGEAVIPVGGTIQMLVSFRNSQRRGGIAHSFRVSEDGMQIFNETLLSFAASDFIYLPQLSR